MFRLEPPYSNNSDQQAATAYKYGGRHGPHGLFAGAKRTRHGSTQSTESLLIQWKGGWTGLIGNRTSVPAERGLIADGLMQDRVVRLGEST